MKEPEILTPIVDAFRGRQFRPTLILFFSTLLILAWKYYGSQQFYHDYLASYFVMFGDPIATAGMYNIVSCFVILGVVPLLMVKFVFRRSLREYGVQLGDLKWAFWSMLVLVPFFVFLAYLSSDTSEIVAEYPINRHAAESPRMFGLHTATYLLFYLGWEFHFRGFLQFGLRDTVGTANAVMIAVMASSLAHLGKPCSESFGAIVGGIIWGIVAFRTRSLLSGLVQHFMLGLTLDIFICYC